MSKPARTLFKHMEYCVLARGCFCAFGMIRSMMAVDSLDGSILISTTVAKFITSFASHFWIGMSISQVEANGQASFLMSRDGIPAALATVDVSTEGIQQIMCVMRPSKLLGIRPNPERAWIGKIWDRRMRD